MKLIKQFSIEYSGGAREDKPIEIKWIIEMDTDILHEYYQWLKDTGQGFMSIHGMSENYSDIKYLEKMLEYAKLIEK